MQRPVGLSDADLDVILPHGDPLDHDVLDSYLQDVFAELAKCSMVGPGATFLICRSIQRKYFHSPETEDHPGRKGVSKHSRELV
jgi:hypothetical protein